jgi:hypothetical protein
MNQSLLPGKDCGLGSICEMQLAEDVADVTFDSIFADYQRLSNFAI